MADLLPPGSDVPIMTVPHAFTDAVQPKGETAVIFHPHPFYTYAEPLSVLEGTTLADIVARAGVPAAYHSHVRVWIDDEEVDRAVWHRVRPKPGRYVYVRVTPQGGGNGGKNILASILMLVVTVAAAFFAPMIAGALFPGLTGAGLKIATSLIGAGLSMLGAMAISALIPPPKVEDQGFPGMRALLSGVRNQFQPYAEIPRIFGKRRVYPLQAARPYTEAQGKNRFLRVLLAVGWGPLQISDLKIGDTPISNYEAVTYQVREGWHADHAQFGAFPGGKSPDTPQTLFTRSVQEENFSVLLEDAGWDEANNEPIDAPGPWEVRVTDLDTSEVSVDVTFPYGLARFNDNGGTEEVELNVNVQYRLVGSATWIDAVWEGPDDDDGTETNGVILGKDKSRTPTSRGGTFKVGAAGQYEVRLRRVTPRLRPIRSYAQRIEWTALRSIKYENPVNLDGLTVIALRLKATDQLNGFPDQINCVAESYLPTYNGTSWTWALSRNPAWAYADLMRRRGTERIIADSRIDLTTIRTWATACDATAPDGDADYWRFDGVIERGAIFTALRQVAAHARASFCIKDGKYSVVRDVAQTVPIQHITPRNSWGYSGQKAFTELPDALRVQFINAERGYQDDEVFVYTDGYDETNAKTFETLDLTGCTNPKQAWRDGRYYLAVGRLRPEQHTVNMDIEHLRCTLGDYVLLSHDVLSIGIGSGRVVDVDVGRNMMTETEFRNGLADTTARGGSVSAFAFGGFEGGLAIARDTVTTYAYKTVTFTQGATYTISVIVQMADGLAPAFAVSTASGSNPANDFAFNIGGTIYTPSLIQDLGGGLYRVSRSGAAGASTNVGIVKYAANTARSFNVSAFQIEAGSPVTDYQRVRATSILGKAYAVMLDGEHPYEAGNSYVLRVRQADGESVLYSLADPDGSVNTNVFEFATPLVLSSAPGVGDLYIYGLSGLEAAPMIVKKIEPGPDMTAKLTLVDAQPGVWTADSAPIPNFQTYISNDTPVDQQRPLPPTFTLLSDENVVERLADGTLQDRIGVTITPPSSSPVPVAGYEVQFRETGANEWRQALVSRFTVRQVFVTPVVQGDAYDVRVRCVTDIGQASDWTTVLGHVVTGKTTPPSDVTGLTAVATVNGVQLTWTPNTDIDLAGYTVKRGTDWDTAALVSKRVAGNTLFVTINTAQAQTFLVKAVDVLGLESPGAAQVTAAVAAPADVTFFDIYQQGDNIRATWTPVAGENIVYEIRNGDSWVTGRKVLRAAGNTATVKWPVRSQTSPLFWIKALSAAGVYSAGQVFASVNQTPVPNRNVIQDTDFTLDSWAGTKTNVEAVGSGAGSTLSLAQQPDGSYATYGEFARTITLVQKFVARSWIELNSTLSSSAGLEWQDAAFTWASATNITWLGDIVENSTSEVVPQIAVADTASVPATLIEAFRLNGTLTGRNGTTGSGSVTYADARFATGLKLGGAATWTIAFPTTGFTVLGDLRITANPGTYAPFMLGIPADPQTGEDFLVAHVYDTANTIALSFRYAAGIKSFVVYTSGQATITIPMEIQAGDVLTWGMAQGPSVKSIWVYNARTGEIGEATAALPPLVTFGVLRLGSVGSADAEMGVVSDVEIRSGVFTRADFAAYAPTKSPVGYQPFKEFVPADYEFQTAIVRLVFKTDDSNLLLSAVASTVRVDVPDVVEVGNATITNAATGVAVTFTRAFSVPPEVTVQQKGGATLAIPQITAGPTTTGFTVKLFDAANPTTAVTGTITFSALGY